MDLFIASREKQILSLLCIGTRPVPPLQMWFWWAGSLPPHAPVSSSRLRAAAACGVFLCCSIKLVRCFPGLLLPSQLWPSALKNGELVIPLHSAEALSKGKLCYSNSAGTTAEEAAFFHPVRTQCNSFSKWKLRIWVCEQHLPGKVFDLPWMSQHEEFSSLELLPSSDQGTLNFSSAVQFLPPHSIFPLTALWLPRGLKPLWWWGIQRFSCLWLKAPQRALFSFSFWYQLSASRPQPLWRKCDQRQEREWLSALGPVCPHNLSVLPPLSGVLFFSLLFSTKNDGWILPSMHAEVLIFVQLKTHMVMFWVLPLPSLH